MTPRAVRAHTFAETYFLLCPVHRHEAQAAFEALEQLARRALLKVGADMPVGAVLASSSSSGETLSPDSLDLIELELAAEAELEDPHIHSQAAAFTRAEHVLRTLLGAAAKRSTWDPETIWMRSIRGIVNERVRHRGGCVCAEASTPANNKMQQTRHG